MSSYRGTAENPDKAKAIAAVLVIHAILAAIILNGLNVRIIAHTVERMTTIEVREPQPPPPPPPPPPHKPKQTKLEEGAAGKKAEPTPVVAPVPKLPVPSPIPAAPVGGTGSATTTGAAQSGTGTGAGGSGSGRGGGGDFSKYTPARRITKIPDAEYRRLSSTGITRGSVGVTVKVNTDGSPTNCRIARTSGDSSIDSLMCDLTLRYVRFDPARDDTGHPVAQDVTFYPNWYR